MDYKSPISAPAADETAGKGLLFITVAVKMVFIAMGAVASMSLSNGNIEAMARDFVAFGRMFQEGTIDAAKTGASIFIPYAKAIRDKIKLMSRLRSLKDWNILVDWAAGTLKLVFDRRGDGWRQIKRGQKIKNIFFVRDEFHILEVAALKIVGRTARQLIKVRPKFSSKLINYIGELKRKNPVFAAYCAEARQKKDNGYAIIMEAQKRALDEVYQEYKGDRQELEEKEKEVRKEYREYFLLLGNELRKSFEIIGKTCGVRSNPKWVAMAALDSCFTDKEGKVIENEANVSTFADNIMSEEFVFFMTGMMKKVGENVYRHAEEPLSFCTYAEGDEAEFVAGEAFVAEEICGKEIITKHAVTKHNCGLEGKYLIGKDENGRWVARKCIMDVLEKPEIDYSRSIIVTAGVPKGTGHIGDMVEKAIAGAEISCSQSCRIDGKIQRQVISCDGVAYANYRSRNAKGFSDKRVQKAFDAIGSGVSGKLTGCIPVEYVFTDSKGICSELECAILILDEMHADKSIRVSSSVFSANKKEEIVFNEPVVTEAMELVGDEW